MYIYICARSPLYLLVTSFIVILFLFYFVLQTKIVSPLPDLTVKLPRWMDGDELLTQDPIHMANQKNYQLQLLDKIKKSNKKNIREKAKMDHDPFGVLVHQTDDQGQRKLVGSSNIMDNKNKAIKRENSDHRLVHLDLKGAPPKIQYLKSIFPLLKSMGATGLLVEYEDMFPYWDELENVAAHNAYTKEDIASLLKEAENYELEFIPLIQTFGHMEFILKLKQFEHLREVPNYPQVICPTHNQTFLLIKKMIDQIIDLHPTINWLHIGADEVYNLAECQRCQSYILKEYIYKDDLFLRYLYKIAHYIKKSYDIQPIMWDDEFRKIPLENIQKSGIGKYVEIMVWKYSPGILAKVGNEIWEKYNEVFQGIWVAGSFKGAALPDTFLTDISKRLDNNKEWMDVLNLYKPTIPFRGIALTGWQRFDHFAVLCELFPQGIPSLAVSLFYVINQKADHNALTEIGKNLGCDSFLNMDLKYIEFVNHCNFPGSKLYEIAQRLFMLKKDSEAMQQTSYVKGWVNTFNIKHKFSSPQMVEHGLQNLSMLLLEFKKILADAENALREVYDESTVREWIETNLETTIYQLNDLYIARKELLSQTAWPRRPFIDVSDKEL